MRKVYEETSWALKKQADWGRQEKEEKEEKTNQRTMGSRKVEGTARIKAQMGTHRRTLARLGCRERQEGVNL